MKTSEPKPNADEERKWCAWCGAWGNHTSGGCEDLKQNTIQETKPNHDN